jgi:hypothetical protein
VVCEELCDEGTEGAWRKSDQQQRPEKARSRRAEEPLGSEEIKRERAEKKISKDTFDLFCFKGQHRPTSARQKCTRMMSVVSTHPREYGDDYRYNHPNVEFISDRLSCLEKAHTPGEQKSQKKNAGGTKKQKSKKEPKNRTKKGGLYQQQRLKKKANFCREESQKQKQKQNRVEKITF